MAELPHELAYLREPYLYNFSGEFFGSTYRLPVLGAILELTPTIEADTLYSREVAELVETDPGNTLREMRRAERQLLIRRSESRGKRNTFDYVRLDSLRWVIIRTALNVVQNELGLLDDQP